MVKLPEMKCHDHYEIERTEDGRKVWYNFNFTIWDDAPKTLKLMVSRHVHGKREKRLEMDLNVDDCETLSACFNQAAAMLLALMVKEEPEAEQPGDLGEVEAREPVDHSESCNVFRGEAAGPRRSDY